jgi:hypothetical protein
MNSIPTLDVPRQIHKYKSKLNYDTIRKINQRRLTKINNIFIEAELTISALLRLRNELQGMSTPNNRLSIICPSVRGKDKSITRNVNFIQDMIGDRIASREYIQSLVFAVSLTEEYISDILVSVIRAYPEKLMISPRGSDTKERGSHSVDLRDILRLGTLEELISEKAAQRVREAMYAQPKQYFMYIRSVLGFDFEELLIDKFIEIKATRDLYVHGDGIANEIYVKKTAKAARAKVGEKVKVDGLYLRASIACMKRMFSTIYKGLMDKYGDSPKLRSILSHGSPAFEVNI